MSVDGGRSGPQEGIVSDDLDLGPCTHSWDLCEPAGKNPHKCVRSSGLHEWRHRCACGATRQRTRQVANNRYLPLMDRFWPKVRKGDGCWIWTGSKTGKGYGQVNENGRGRLAHRVAWELARGPIPAGMTIDHLCYVKDCVNPEHLEVVSRGENARRYTEKMMAERGRDG